MNKKVLILSVIMALLFFVRIILNDSDELVYIVAGINLVAVLCVVGNIIEKTVYNIHIKIKETGAPKQLINRELRKSKKTIWSIGIGGSLVAITLYLVFLCSNLGNDIISIGALAVALLDDDIAEIVVANYKI